MLAEAFPQSECLLLFALNPAQYFLRVDAGAVLFHQIERCQRMLDERPSQVHCPLHSRAFDYHVLGEVLRHTMKNSGHPCDRPGELRPPIAQVVQPSALRHERLDFALESLPGLIGIRGKFEMPGLPHAIDGGGHQSDETVDQFAIHCCDRGWTRLRIKRAPAHRRGGHCIQKACQ